MNEMSRSTTWLFSKGSALVVVLGVAVAVGLAGCGSQEPAAASNDLSQLGSCPSDYVDWPSLADRFDPTYTWHQSDSLIVLDTRKPTVDDRRVDARVEIHGTPQVLSGDQPIMEQAALAATKGASLLIATNPEEKVIVHAIALPGDGQAVFAGECLADTTKAFISIADELGTTPADLLLEYAADTKGSALATWLTESTQPLKTWAETAPRARSVHPADTPADIFDRQIALSVEFDTDQFTKFDTARAMCTFGGQGWNDCFDLRNINPVGLVAYVEPGQPLEVWLFDESGRYDGDHILLGTISDSDIAAVGDQVLTITLTGTPDKAAIAVSVGPMPEANETAPTALASMNGTSDSFLL